jgi:CRP-like cAMP-binding protein
LLTALSRQVQELAATVHDLMHRDAESRLAVWLMQRCTARDASNDGLQLRLAERKRDIAAQLGITPETLSRTMRLLSDKGLIEVDGYTVRVLDLAALRQLAT